MLKRVGFVDAELVMETGFNSSPVTKGALFRASKTAQKRVAARWSER